jgi:hypothetical protein
VSKEGTSTGKEALVLPWQINIRDLVCVKRDLVCVKRDLVCVKRRHLDREGGAGAAMANKHKRPSMCQKRPAAMIQNTFYNSGGAGAAVAKGCASKLHCRRCKEM